MKRARDSNALSFCSLLRRDQLFNENGPSPTKLLLDNKIENDKAITKRFYGEYKGLRSRLFNHIKDNNPALSAEIAIDKTQKLLDRIVFICLCEDYDFLPHRKTLDAIVKEKSDAPIWDRLKGLFSAIDNGYPEQKINRLNGGLFKQDIELDNLKLSDAILAQIAKIEENDFAEDLTVNILGHIFEQSITDLEEIKAHINSEPFDKKRGKRKNEGVYYTPEVVTRYIVEQSVGGWIENKKQELGYYTIQFTDDELEKIRAGNYREGSALGKKLLSYLQNLDRLWSAIQNIKVLDPACGSGSFLVQAVNRQPHGTSSRQDHGTRRRG